MPKKSGGKEDLDAIPGGKRKGKEGVKKHPKTLGKK